MGLYRVVTFVELTRPGVCIQTTFLIIHLIPGESAENSTGSRLPEGTESVIGRSKLYLGLADRVEAQRRGKLNWGGC